MVTKDLSLYLHRIFDLETSLFQQKMILSNLSHEKENVKVGEYKEVGKTASKKIGGELWLCFSVHLVWFIIATFWYSLASDSPENHTSGQMEDLIYTTLLSVLHFIGDINDALLSRGLNQELVFILIVFIFPCGVDILIIFNSILKYNKYVQKMKQYNNYVLHHNQGVSALRKSVKDKIIYKMHQIEKYCLETENVLEKMYSINIIYPKYQNLVAVGMFCEYFDSGRCVTLEGHEGAYNIYENEIRQNIIISKLDDIIYKLDSIERNQYFVYQAIQNSNKTIKKISKELLSQIDRIEENQYLNSYYSKVAAKNTEFLAWERMFAAR